MFRQATCHTRYKMKVDCQVVAIVLGRAC